MVLLTVSGILCRLLLYNTTLYSQPNLATITFTTPTNVAPDSMLLCFPRNVQLNASNFQVASLAEGGDIFNNPTQNVTLYPESFWTRSPFFLPMTSSIGLSAAEYGNITDVLSTDAFYGGSYFVQRLDNMWRDWTNQSITGMVTWSNPAIPSSPQVLAPASGNCVLLTGAWKIGTLYEMSFTFTNPDNNAGYGVQAMPLPWLAPITNTIASVKTSSGATITDASFAVRSSKYGALCGMRPKVATALGTLWSPCVVLGRILNTTFYNDKTSEYCLTVLRLIASNSSVTTTFPFSTPPLTTYTTSSWPEPQTLCAAQGLAYSTRYGGQCVDCGSGYQKSAGSPCICPSGVAPALIGGTACPQAPRSDGSTEASKALAANLCVQFNITQTRWLNKTLSAKVVSRLVLKAFRIAAQSIIDDTAIAAANATFYSTLVFDDRRPNSPTHVYGIKPVCNKCDEGPTFSDVFNRNRPAWLFDNQFDAMNTFRFIGYLLNSVVGVPCTSLWDPNNPMQWKYGFYQDIMCQPLKL